MNHHRSSRHANPILSRFLVAIALFGAVAWLQRIAQADTASSWSSETSGDWTDGSLWSTNPTYPNNGSPSGTNYDATIAATGGTAYTVTLNSDITVNSVTINSADATLDQTSGTFMPGTITLDAGTYQMDGGTLAGSTVDQAGGTFTVNNGTLNNVAVTGGDLNVNADLYVPGTLSIADHNLNLNSSSVYFNGQSIDALNITGGGYIYASGGGSGSGPQTLTLGSNVTVQSGVSFEDNSTGDTLINNGTINVDGLYNSSSIDLDNFTNNATAEATNGGTLNIGSSTTTWTNASIGTISANGSALILGGSWSNAGTISATNASTVNLGGTFTPAGLGNFSADASSAVNITGSLNNSSATFYPASYGGKWLLAGGTITNGTLNVASTATGSFTVEDGILNGVSVTGGDLTVQGNLTIVNGVTVADNNLVLSSGEYDAPSRSVTFDGPSQTINNLNISSAPNYFGNEIYFGGPTSGGPVTDTLGSNASITGSGYINAHSSDNTLINNGTINANNSSFQPLVVYVNFTNNATAEATNGGTLTIDSLWTNASTGTISANGSTLTLGGSWSNAGTISATNSSTVNLSGTFTSAGLGNFSADASSTVNINASLNNSGATFYPASYGGTWYLVGGTITNGTLNIAPAATGSFTVEDGTLNGVSVTGGDLNVSNSIGIMGTFSIADHNLNLGSGAYLDFDGQTLRTSISRPPPLLTSLPITAPAPAAQRRPSPSDPPSQSTVERRSRSTTVAMASLTTGRSMPTAAIPAISKSPTSPTTAPQKPPTAIRSTSTPSNLSQTTAPSPYMVAGQSPAIPRSRLATVR